MSENPYQAPETHGTSVFAKSKPASAFPLLIMLSIAVAFEAISTYSMSVPYEMFESDPAAWIFWATPVVALLLSAIFALWGTAAVSLRQPLTKLMGVTMLSLFVAAGGYICFATTCCCSNLVVETISPAGTAAGRISFSVICAATMVGSCLVTSSALRNFSKRKIVVNEDDWV